MRRSGLAWLMIIAVGACGFPLLETSGTQVVEVGAACEVDATCNAPPNDNPCRPGTCGTGKNCEYSVLDGVAAPDSLQTAADCKAVFCTAGVAAEQEDPADVANDGNPCTTDACVNGSPMNTALPDGSICQQGTKSGFCKNNLCQVACATNTDCDDMNPCTEEFCNSAISTCSYTKLDGVPTPGFSQIAGDCKVQSCIAGVDTSLNDDADIKDDGNPCTTDLCNGGTPVNAPLPERTLCMPGGTDVCSSFGVCVQCVVADDCVNIVETECEKRSCVNNKCEIAYQGQTTLASPVLQTARDCRKVVCSGMANPPTVTINDDSDLPDDGNPCTKNLCTNGMPVNPPEVVNLPCGGSNICDGSGHCVGCNTPADCVMLPPDDFCKKRTCINQVCGLSFTPNGTDLDMGQVAGDCKVLECDGMGNVKTSVLTTDVPVDGKQCTNDVCSIQGVPSNPNSPINTVCNENGNNTCDGAGACKKSNGTACVTPTECVSTFCADGVCCSNACTTDCRACNLAGSMGTCSTVPKGSDDGSCTGATISCNTDGTCDKEIGGSCSNSNECLNGNCRDSFCCDGPCNSLCQACSSAKTGGMSGTCGPVLAGTDPDNECATQAQNSCGQTGFCGGGTTCQLYPMGTNCGDMLSCTGSTQTNADTCNGTGMCIDGGILSCAPFVCMGSTCKLTCAVDSDCANGYYCSNMNCTPKLINGTACTAPGQCASGFCVDDVCCDAACTGMCQACTSAKTTQTNGQCKPIPLGSDPDDECMMAAASTCGQTGSCNGAGGCEKYPLGTACTAQSCTGTTQTNASTCNATNMCMSNGTTNCSPYICGATACKLSCTTSSDCVTTHYCSSMTCQPKKPVDAPCVLNEECISGMCNMASLKCK